MKDILCVLSSYTVSSQGSPWICVCYAVYTVYHYNSDGKCSSNSLYACKIYYVYMITVTELVKVHTTSLFPACFHTFFDPYFSIHMSVVVSCVNIYCHMATPDKSHQLLLCIDPWCSQCTYDIVFANCLNLHTTYFLW